MKPNPVPGDRYHSWTVIASGQRRGHWLCRCQCGTEREVSKGNLVHSLSRQCRQCGMQETRRALNIVLASGKGCTGRVNTAIQLATGLTISELVAIHRVTTQTIRYRWRAGTLTAGPSIKKVSKFEKDHGLSARDAAKVIGVSREMAYKYANDGTLAARLGGGNPVRRLPKFIRTSKSLRVALSSDVLQWLAKSVVGDVTSSSLSVAATEVLTAAAAGASHGESNEAPRDSVGPQLHANSDATQPRP